MMWWSNAIPEGFQIKGKSSNGIRSPMELVSREGQYYRYQCVLEGQTTGQVGYSARVLPTHPALDGRFVPGLVRWAQ